MFLNFGQIGLSLTLTRFIKEIKSALSCIVVVEDKKQLFTFFVPLQNQVFFLKFTLSPALIVRRGGGGPQWLVFPKTMHH